MERRRLARPARGTSRAAQLAAELGGDACGDGTALFELGGFYRETVAFLDAVAAGRAPSPSLRESRQSVEIAERIRDGAAEYRPVHATRGGR